YKEHKQHDRIPYWNERMLISGTTEHVTQACQRGTQRSHNKSRRPPDHPCRKGYRQKVERRDCPLAAGNIIHEAKSKCQDDSSCCRDTFPSRRKFLAVFHNKAKNTKRFDRALRQSVHATVTCSEQSRRERLKRIQTRACKALVQPLVG